MSTAAPQFSTNELLVQRDQLRHLLTRFRVAFRFTWVGALIVILVGGGAVVVALKTQRRYTSKAVVFHRQMIQASDLGTERRGGTFLDLGTQLQEMLFTRPRLTEIVNEYDLYPKTVKTRGMDAAVDELRKNLVLRITAGNTLHLSFTADSPKVAQSVVATLTNAMIADESRLRTEGASVTAKFLAGELKRAVEDLHTKEKVLASFLAKHSEFIIETGAGGGAPSGGDGAGGPTGHTLRPGRTKVARSVDATLLALERQAARIRAQLTGQPEAPPVQRGTADLEMDRMISTATDELREARRNLEHRQAQFTDIHPDVKAAKQRVAEAEARLKRLKAMKKAPAPYTPPASTADAEALNAALTKITRQIEARRRRTPEREGESETAASAVVSLEVEWTRINREASEARSRVLNLEGRQFKASLAESSEASGQASEMKVIDPAFLPSHPTGKGRAFIVMIGAALAFLLAGTVMFGLAFLDDRIYDRTDIQGLRLVPILVVIPRKMAELKELKARRKPKRSPRVAERAAPAVKQS